ncbi:dihydrolipoamide acetyltransferase family protein [Azospirillum sp. sgz302134]
MATFRMPSLGADMAAGTLVEWLKKPGDPVRRGDIIAVVETQKGAIEVEVFEDGVVQQILAEPGATLPVGTPLATIAGTGGEPAAEAVERAAAPSPVPSVPVPSVPARSEPASAPLPDGVGQGRRPVSPVARRLAARHGIALSGLRGHGPGGAILLADVERAVAAPARRPAGLNLAEMRQAIAAAMARSKREIPHYYLSTTVDLSKAQSWLATVNADRPPERRLLLAALELKAVALALRRLPEFNGHHRDGAFQPGQGIHVGAAVAIRGGGLAAPAIHDTDRLGLDELMERFRDLVARTRAGHLRSSELGDPTITVTSLGDRGVDGVFGVIYPPQVAIVGFGRPAERPWVVDGRLAVRPLVTLTLAADHRVSDGHRGSLFLADIDRLLQEPEAL